MSFPLARRALVIVVLCSAGLICAQQEVPGSKPIQSPRNPESRAPFSLTGTGSLVVQVRQAEAMSQQDKVLEAGAESVIREKAGFEDLGFNEEGWTYKQLICPAFPNHLLLRFTRNGSSGERSMFSVSIPRTMEGQIRVVPILRKGYSLFSPAPVNAMGLGAVRHMLAEEPAENKPEFGALAVCYAALTGAPSVAAPNGESIEPAAPPAVDTNADGSFDLRFSMAGARPMRYDLFFDRKGRLIKASRSEDGVSTAHTIPAGPAPKEYSIPQGRQADWKVVPPASH